MAAVLLLISRILQDGTAIMQCDLYYVLVYLSFLCRISSSVFYQITDVQKTLRPFIHHITSLILVSSSSPTTRGPIRKRTCSCWLCGTMWSFALSIPRRDRAPTNARTELGGSSLPEQIP